MAAPEPSYVVAESVVETKPRVRQREEEEVREETVLLELNRLPPEEKLRLEREAVAGAAGEVEIVEKAWRKTRPEGLAEIERAVDTLRVGEPLPARAPEAAALRPRPRPRTIQVEAPPAGRGARPVAGRLSPSEREALARHLAGEIGRADVLFATSRGRVVEVEYKRGGEALSTTVLLREDGGVATLDEIYARLDAEPQQPPPTPSGAPEPGEPAEHRGEERPPEPGPGAQFPRAGVPAPPAQEGGARGEGRGPTGRRKLKLGLKLLGKKPTRAPEPAARAEPAAPQPEEEQGPAKGKRKFRLRLGRT